MSEYSNVEQPFLNKLRQLDWDVIDHGSGFIPQDPQSASEHHFVKQS